MGKKTLKMLLPVLALSLLALVPAVANAAIKMESPLGTKVGVGAQVKITNYFLTLEDGSTTYSCLGGLLEGEVTAIEDPKISITSGVNWGSAPSGRCGAPSGLSVAAKLKNPPATLNIGSTGGQGTVIATGLTYEYNVYSKENSLLAECEYTGEILGGFYLGTEPINATTVGTFTRVKGNATYCASTMLMTAEEREFTKGANPINAHQPGLYFSTGSGRYAMIKDNAVGFSSSNFTITNKEAKIQCTTNLLSGKADDPSANPARVNITSSTFSGTEGGGRCSSGRPGITMTVTTNASSGWQMNFNYLTGGELKGSPLKFTLGYYLSGTFYTACTYEANSIATSYGFSKDLGLDLASTTLTPVAGATGLCALETKIDGDFKSSSAPIQVWTE